jgi:hypothetical protein
LAFKTVHSNSATFFLSDLKVFNRLPGNFVNWTHVKEVVHVFAVELQELYLDFELAKLGLTLAVH